MAFDNNSSNTMTIQVDGEPEQSDVFTRFKPLSPDVRSHSPFSFSNLFKKKDSKVQQLLDVSADVTPPQTSPVLPRKVESPPPQWAQRPKQLHFDSCVRETRRKSSSSGDSPGEMKGNRPTRTLSTVLKRISSLIDSKNQFSQIYRESDFKQYWMPDSNCKECYDCGDKFTTFRRRHHCRVCGQIFCSRCCNQEVPGKFMGYSGNLRVCLYCCKVVLSYAHSADGNFRSLQEDLRRVEEADQLITPKKRSSLFKEEDFTRTRTYSSTSMIESPNSSTNPFEIAVITPMSEYQKKTGRHSVAMERKMLVQDSAQLRDIWLQIQNPTNGIEFQSHRYRLRTYVNCIIGSELVDWLISTDKAANRYQGIAIGQALIDANWLESVLGTDLIYSDEYALYRPGKTARQENLSDDDVHSVEEYWEPTWFKEIDLQEKGASSAEEDDVEEPDGRTLYGSASSLATKESETSQFSLDLERATVNYRPKKKKQSTFMTTDRDSQRDSGGSWDFNFCQDSNSGNIADDFKGAMSVVTVAEELNVAERWQRMEHLREENGEKLAMERLSTANYNHLVALLKQQLQSEGLSLSWTDIIFTLITKISDMVKPDVRHDDDDMDIRQYVQFKKVPGGQKTDCSMINGVVCTKHVAHKKMRTYIVNPKILLLTAAIEYQRVENKLSSLDPVVLQEHEFLKNCVAKIANVQPEILVVEKSVARLAQDFLHHAGITVVLSVKTQVMERIARCTQADLVSSIDQVSKPRLGFCHSFRLQSFKMEDGCMKTLMFFEGCATHLGCTIILRGGSQDELAKVKKVMHFMVYAAYNSRLEMSYLMDQFAMPPLPPESDKETVDECNTDDVPNSPEEEFDDRELLEDITDGKLSKHSSQENILDDDWRAQERINKEEQQEQTGEEKTDVQCEVTEIKSSNSLSCGDKDLNAEDNKMLHFMKALETVHLSCSPYLTYKVPYLITHQGLNCQVRPFFPEQIYWSARFSNNMSVSNGAGQDTNTDQSNEMSKTDMVLNNENLDEIMSSGNGIMVNHTNGHKRDYGVYFGHKYNPRNVKIGNPHDFVIERLRLPLSEDATKSFVAEFRARGCRLRLLQHDKDNDFVTSNGTDEDVSNNYCEAVDDEFYQRQTDCLDPNLHQRIAVLFSSSCSKSSNAPNPCVYPWVVSMDFYGRNDITLGAFLERYCFRQSYMCPSTTCDMPMVDHSRKFVHGNSCLQILLRELDSPIPGYQDNILMWSWCKKCKQVTPVVPMTQDSWSLSFAKYLELHFYGDNYGRRASTDPCKHSLNHEHYQYFGHQNMVASFKHSRVSLMEVALPPIIIEQQQRFQCWSYYYREIKHAAFKGHNVYSEILERIMKLKEVSSSQSRDRKLKDFITQQKLDQDHFRKEIEKTQAALEALGLDKYGRDEECKMKNDYPAELYSALYKLSNDIIEIKRLTCSAVLLWNERLYDLIQQERNLKKVKTTMQNKMEDEIVTTSPVDQISSSVVVTVETPSPIQNTTNQEKPPEFRSLLRPTIHRASTWGPQTSSPLTPSFMYDSAESSTLVTGSPSSSQQLPQCKLEQLIEEHEADRERRKSDNIVKSNDKDRAADKLSHRRVSSLGGEKPHFIKQLSAPHGSSTDTSEYSNVHAGSDETLTPKLADKRSAMKNIFANFLSGPMFTPLACPYPADEHYTLPPGSQLPVVVFDNEPSSIIAYAISCKLYEQKIFEMKQSLKACKDLSVGSTVSSSNSSPSNRPRSQKPTILKNTEELETGKQPKIQSGRRSSKVLAFLKSSLTNTEPSSYIIKPKSEEWKGADRVYYKVEDEVDSPSDDITKDSAKDETDFGFSHREEKSNNPHHPPNPHIELQFSDNAAKYYCRVYFAEQFQQLRKLIFPAGEEAYIRSLSQCFQWMARGGKSGSSFCKTTDDRFILKQMSRLEVNSFTEFAPHYFQYIKTACEEKRPTALAKILGVYRVGFRNSQTNGTMKQDLLVMENLFYDRKMSQVFDLKGSMRNRHVDVSGGETEDLVLLDENLLKYVVDTPLYIRTHSKTVLTVAIYNDSQFLSSHLVMDYSLLVGIDETRKELVVGIIDYIRTFTWDKKLEMVVKSSGILGGQGKMPTVVSPELYRTRFCEAMDRYFLMVPDRWTGLGRDVEC